MVIRFQPVVPFQDAAQFSKGPICPVGFLHRQSRWVDLIDGDMDVEIVCVVMDDAHPLMFAIPQTRTDSFLNGLENFCIGIFSRPEADKQDDMSYRLWPAC